VRAGNVADCVNHCEHDQTEGQRDANMRNCTARRFIDHNRAGPGKDETERPHEFRHKLLHALSATQCSSQNESIFA
jgi:hypothetical protein